MAECFDQLVSSVEELVGIFNRGGIAEDLEYLDQLLQETGSIEQRAPITIDLASLTAQSRNPNNALLTSLVDMAKVEVLTLMGENEKALELVERHIRTNDTMWE